VEALILAVELSIKTERPQLPGELEPQSVAAAQGVFAPTHPMLQVAAAQTAVV